MSRLHNERFRSCVPAVSEPCPSEGPVFRGKVVEFRKPEFLWELEVWMGNTRVIFQLISPAVTRCPRTAPSAASRGLLEQAEKTQPVALRYNWGVGCSWVGGHAVGKKRGGKVLEKVALLQFLPVICCRSNFSSPCLVSSCCSAGGGGYLYSWLGKAAWGLGAAVFRSVIKKRSGRFNFPPIFP